MSAVNKSRKGIVIPWRRSRKLVLGDCQGAYGNSYGPRRKKLYLLGIRPVRRLWERNTDLAILLLCLGNIYLSSVVKVLRTVEAVLWGPASPPEIGIVLSEWNNNIPLFPYDRL
jgi:hypothetical protein